jgi:uncharacterized membrane protein (GlpM family)
LLCMLDLLFDLHDEDNAVLQNVEFLARAYSVTSQEMVRFVSYECLKAKMTEIFGHFCIIFYVCFLGLMYYRIKDVIAFALAMNSWLLALNVVCSMPLSCASILLYDF